MLRSAIFGAISAWLFAFSPILADAQISAPPGSHNLTGAAVRALVSAVSASSQSFDVNDVDTLRGLAVSVSESAESVNVVIHSVSGTNAERAFVYSKSTRTFHTASVESLANAPLVTTIPGDEVKAISKVVEGWDSGTIFVPYREDLNSDAFDIVEFPEPAGNGHDARYGLVYLSQRTYKTRLGQTLRLPRGYIIVPETWTVLVQPAFTD